MTFRGLNATEAIPGLLPLLKHKDPEVRKNAISALGDVGDDEVARAIEPLLADREKEVRSWALHALGRLGSKGSADSIIPLLADPDADLRAEATEVLVKTGAREKIPELVRLLGDEEAEVRRKALWGLRIWGVRDEIPRMKKLLDDPNSSVRWNAVSAMADLGVKDSIPLLLIRLKDESQSVRRRTAEVLAELDATGAIPHLMPLLEDRSGHVRLAAASSLCYLGFPEGAFPLIEEVEARNAWGILFPLSALREREIWKKLGEIPWTRGTQPTMAAFMEELTSKSGLLLEYSDAVRKEKPDWLSKDLNASTWLSAKSAKTAWRMLAEISRYTHAEVILDKDRIRVMTRKEALAFWQAWWKDEKRKQ